MIEITINEEKKRLSDINPDWIHRQVKGRENDDIPVCITISIKKPGIDLVLSCGECGSSGSGGRAPNLEEKKVFDLWGKFNCGDRPINTGQLVAFLQQVSS
ncbi:hypothetical protein ACMXYX_11760 [Neptuniibacter sp. QD72_48]|uniref:hypothetical protein n=1 Tax=Neptuniibacter sp. QD72_48 TaxID=3398214 RepID=UPI0039F636D3